MYCWLVHAWRWGAMVDAGSPSPHVCLSSCTEGKQQGSSTELSAARDALEKEQAAHASTKAEMRRVRDDLRAEIDKNAGLKLELERGAGPWAKRPLTL